jgi:hypothetical protein
MSIFNAIKMADDLESAVLTTLQKWFPTYVKEFELQSGMITSTSMADVLPAPKSWLKSDQLDREASDALPSVIVISPGLSKRNPPRQEGDGSFRVRFNVAIGVIVSADVRSHTSRLVRIYTAIIRTIMLQQQDLGGYADGSAWIDETYDDNFRFSDDETISAGEVIFEIEIAGIVNRRGGPAIYKQLQPAPDPLRQPGSEWVKTEKVRITVNNATKIASHPLQEDFMYIAATVAGLGKPAEDGVAGQIRIGNYPNDIKQTLWWNKSANRWISEEVQMLTELDQWGLRLDDTITLTNWQYFYRPVYFATQPTGGWGTLPAPLDNVDALYAAGLTLEEKIGGLMNGNGTQAMTVAAYYAAFAPGDLPNVYSPTGGLGFGNMLVGPVSAYAGGERGMDWRPSPDVGFQPLPIATPTKPKLRASLYGKMGAGAVIGAGNSGEISDIKVSLRWVGVGV